MFTQNQVKYIYKLMEEKEIKMNEVIKVEIDGQIQLLNIGQVVTAIEFSSQQDIEKIANKLRKIDFANGDVMHFMKYVAVCIFSEYINA